MVMRNLSVFLPLICFVARPRSGGALGVTIQSADQKDEHKID
jgi:hypothetical protein